MADEIFRNIDEFTSSDIIYSMKEQMTPSDAVVSSLLAKIAACDASSENFDNTVPFAPTDVPDFSIAGFTEETVHEQKRRVNMKPIWKYGSIAVAGLFVLVSTFALMGDNDSSEFKDLVNNVFPDHVISDPVNGDDDDAAVVGSDESSDSEKSNSENIDGSDADENDSHNKDGENTDSDKTKDEKDSSDNSSNQDDGNASTAPAPTDSNSGNGNNGGAFDREILANDVVSHIAISGTNYVVDTTATSVTTGSKIKAITLKIPESSNTNSTVLNAQVKELDNVSSDLMVALDVEGLDEALVYMNASYQPSTLDQFISDAGLDLNTGYSSTVYCKGNTLGYASYHRLQVGDINEFVDTYAFANRAASVAKYSAYKNADTHITFKTSSNPTGSVINFGVSDNGYLYVKLSGGKAFTFNIGTDSAEAFINAVTEK